MRFYPEAGACGGYTNAGEFIFQAEHLITRSNSVSFADMRNIVYLCWHYHGHFRLERSPECKDAHRATHRPRATHCPERSAWAQRVLGDRSPYRFHLADWKAIQVALTAELADLKNCSQGRTVVAYVVEVENKGGRKATKEYEGRSFDELRTKVAMDLRGYPEIHIAGVWRKGRPNERIFVGRW